MKIKHIIYTLLSILILAGCEKEEVIIPKESLRTVLVYMAADNSLGSSNFDKQNISSMLKGATDESLNGGNLIVYKDSPDTIPQLIQITPAGERVLREYPEHQNSVSVATMQEIISEVIQEFPADSYGLILWSHGSNWFPSKMATRAFGQDKTNWMELSDLQQALPDNGFEFIIFDACYMAGVEVMYAMKNKADYMIAAPTEIMGSGFPYSDIIKPMFAKKTGYQEICDNFYSYYADSSTPFATISLISTQGLDQLATATRNIMKTSFDKTDEIDFNDLQRYFRPKYYGMYDFDDYISRIAPDDLYAQFQTAMNNAVLYKKNTDSFMLGYSGGYYITHYSGLSSFIIRESYGAVNQEYAKLDWYKAVYE